MIRAEGSRLEGFIRDKRKRERDLREFKTSNGLSRDARYRDNDIITTIFVLVLLIAVEAGISSVLFSNQGLSGGIIGAALFAIVASVINAVCLGYVLIGMVGLRLMSHAEAYLKSIGRGVVALGISAAIGFNFVIASLRGDTGATGLAQLADVLISGTGLQAMTAATAGIFVIGLVVCLLGALKGRSGIYDSYWGFAEMDRASRSARRTVEQAESDVRDAAQDALDRALSDLEKELDDSKTAQQRSHETSNSARTSLHQAAASSKILQDQADRKLRLYRELNIDTRDRDRPPPAHFDDYVLPTFNEIGSESVDAAMEELESRLVDNDHAAQQLRDLIYKEAEATESRVAAEIERAYKAASDQDAGAPRGGRANGFDRDASLSADSEKANQGGASATGAT